MSRVIDEHRLYLSDRARLCAYERALRDVVRPGSIVVDLASGTGILGMLACRAGAARVYAIEATGLTGLAREIARANRLDDRIVVVRDHSTTAVLPERGDVIVSDQIGRFGLEAGILEYFADARARFLKPGGVLVPFAVTLIAAPVTDPRLFGRVEFWDRRPAGFEYAPAREIARNTGFPARLSREQCLARPADVLEVDLATQTGEMLGFDASFEVSRAGTFHGLAGWFRAALAPGVTMTNAPGDPDRIRRRQAFFPVARGVEVAAGDTIDVTMRMRPGDLLYAWDVRVRGASAGAVRFRHSTLNGMLLDDADVHRTAPAYQPVLTPRGAARLTVLALCDGVRTLAEIEADVQARHPGLFATRGAAATFVAEVVTRYSTDAL